MKNSNFKSRNTLFSLLISLIIAFSSPQMSVADEELNIAEINSTVLEIRQCITDENGLRINGQTENINSLCISKVNNLCIDRHGVDFISARLCWDVQFSAWERIRIEGLRKVELETGSMVSDQLMLQETLLELHESDRLWSKERNHQCNFLAGRLGQNPSGVDKSYTCLLETEAIRAILYLSWNKN